jgi:GNAT superfamily N-acetyltransferase
MTTAELQFEKLDINGLKTLVDWAIAEGWNPGLHDADAFFATDPDGFFGCYQAGELIAGGSIVAYGEAFGFMGFFIVHPAHRSHGIGRQLWFERRNRLLARLNPGAAIGMDGVVAMQPFYAKGGFKKAHNDFRYEAYGKALFIHSNISEILGNDFDAIVAYDTPCFGLARPQFLKPWLSLPESSQFKYEEEGIVKGYAVVRKVQRGYKIGPLFADTPAVAEALYQACLNVAMGETLYLDVPALNLEAIEMVKKYDAVYVFECARMYYGAPPITDINKIFGVTTFELG